MRPPYDAALVLGVELDADDAPTEELARRVMAAARAYRDGACARLVLCGGRVNGVVDARHITKEEIGLMMTNRREGAVGNVK